MKKFFLLILIVIAGYLIAKPCFALYGAYEEFQNNQEEQTSLTSPAGSFYSAMLGETVSSEFNNNGDVIKIMVSSDYTIGNKVLIPQYSMFIGVVTNLEKAQRLLDERFKNKQISNDEYIRQSNELKKKIEQCKGTIGRDF